MCKSRTGRALALLLGAVCLMSFGLLGCGQAAAAPNALQLIDKTVAAAAKVKSFKLDTYLTENYIVTGVSDNSVTTDSWQFTAQKQVDVANKKLYQVLDNYSLSGSGSSSFAMTSYIAGEWEYYCQSQPWLSTPAVTWNKTSLEAEPSAWEKSVQLQPQVDLLQNSQILGDVKTVSEDGRQYFVIDLLPSASAAADWVLSQQQRFGSSLGWFRTGTERSREIYAKAYTGGSVRLWIDQKNDLIVKAETNLLFDAVPGNIMRGDTGLMVAAGQENSEDVGFTHILRSFSGHWEFSDYNQSVSIELPAAALNATEHP
ncbi:MAG: hypothetical protein WC370_08375 [Dehalococcoidales bacterium]|jgi:hypothetical protein